MRRRGTWELTALLVVGLAAGGVRAADDGESGTAKSTAKPSASWWNPFGFWAKAKEKKTDAQKEEVQAPKPSAKKAALPAKQPSVVDEAASERLREEALLLRRLQACDRLREIAARVNDSDLLRRAEEMDERARTLYSQRTVYLRNTVTGRDGDEQTLQEQLDTGGTTKAQLLEAPVLRAASKERTDRAAAKEVGR